MQKLLDNHNNDIISDTIANGDKLNYKSIIRIDELKNAGIELKEANEEWIITGGKIEKVTITSTLESIEELKKAGFDTGVTVQGQVGAATPTITAIPSSSIASPTSTTSITSVAAPTGTPVTGRGPTSPDTFWLNLTLMLVALISLSGSNLWLIRYQRKG